MEMVSCENLDSTYEWKERGSDAAWIIEHFINSDDEVLYFVENQFLKAVVSIGDVFGFLEGKKKEILNTDFTRILEGNTDQADRFFSSHPTIHELPVVDASGRMIGVMRLGNGNPEMLKNRFRSYLKTLCFDVESYYQNAAEKFMEHFKGTVLLIELPDDKEVLKRLKDRDRGRFAEKHGISPLAQLVHMEGQKERDYWGEMYEDGISKKFADEFSNIKVSVKNGCNYYINSETSNYITFDHGKRRVINKNAKAGRTIYIVGPCTIFGAYVTDHQTVEYYLQQFLRESGHSFQVVNFGALGLYYEFQYLLTEGISSQDIVVIASQNKKLTAVMRAFEQTYYLGDYSDLYDTIEDPVSCILDTFRHVNYRISEEIARRLYVSLKPYLVSVFHVEACVAAPVQNYFIPWDVVEYYREFAVRHQLDYLSGNVGAVVMNCNPFTMGHRHLIEYAASRVDNLIIFVVEEDASVFSFKDRMEMVRLGTEDISHVIVVPSGKYNISKSTFAQYFEKDKRIDRIESMEYDIRIFCEVIAKIMDISCRFAGEEPADAVTRRYNENMGEILPQYGMEFIEIPRLTVCRSEELISASMVRALLEQGDWDGIRNFLPMTTVNYLKAKKKAEQVSICQRFP